MTKSRLCLGVAAIAIAVALTGSAERLAAQQGAPAAVFAASAASRVFPTPAAPASTNAAASGPSSRSTIRLSSLSRHISGMLSVSPIPTTTTVSSRAKF